VSRDVIGNAEEAYQSSARRVGYKLNTMSHRETVKDYVAPDDQYFYLELPNSRMLYHGRSFPFQFGREVTVYLLGLGAERIDWRNTQVVYDAEMKNVAQYKKNFKPYDFNL